MVIVINNEDREKNDSLVNSIQSEKTKDDLLDAVDVEKSPTPLRGGKADRWNNPHYKVLKVDEFAQICKDIVDNDYQVIVVISGMTGTGKSTLANLIAQKFNHLNNKLYLIRKSNYYENKALHDGITTCENKTGHVGDEAINILFKRDNAKKENKGLLKLIDMIRYKNLLTIFCVPSFWAIDSHTRNSQVTFWIHITKRKLGWIFTPSKNCFTTDPWNQGYNEMSLRKRFVPSNSDNFFSGIYFDKMPKKMEEVYLKHKYKMSALSSQHDKEFIYSPKEVDKIVSKANALTKWVTISYLRDKDLLKPITVGVLAKEEDKTVQAINTRLTKMRKHFDTITNKVKRLDIEEPDEVEELEEPEEDDDYVYGGVQTDESQTS